MCGPLLPDSIPDAAEGGCCIGSAIDGPAHCTCWEPVYDLEQAWLKPGLPLPPIPVRMCTDCAYRPNSPERRGDPAFRGDADDLEDLVWSGEPFYCHQGIRRAVQLVHKPTGTVYDPGPGDYRPPVDGRIPYRADGQPALICAGWLLRRAAATRQPASTAPA
jgi:hypothetical protein